MRQLADGSKKESGDFASSKHRFTAFFDTYLRQNTQKQPNYPCKPPSDDLLCLLFLWGVGYLGYIGFSSPVVLGPQFGLQFTWLPGLNADRIGYILK